MDNVLKENLTKTRFAILVEKSREKLKNQERKSPVVAKHGKNIDGNRTLFPQKTIDKYTGKYPVLSETEIEPEEGR